MKVTVELDLENEHHREILAQINYLASKADERQKKLSTLNQTANNLQQAIKDKKPLTRQERAKLAAKARWAKQREREQATGSIDQVKEKKIETLKKKLVQAKKNDFSRATELSEFNLENGETFNLDPRDILEGNFGGQHGNDDIDREFEEFANREGLGEDGEE